KVGPAAAVEWKSVKELVFPGATPQLRRHLELTQKLLTLELLDSEWIEYKEHSDLTPRGTPALAKAVAAAERFYIAAEARNSAMTENLLRSIGVSGEPVHAMMEETDKQRVEDSISPVRRSRKPVASRPVEPVAGGPAIRSPWRSVAPAPVVLVTGGFHTATIAHALKERGISFVVISPEVDKLDQASLYVQSMTEPPHETVMAYLTTAQAGLPLLRKMSSQLNGTLGNWGMRRFVA